MKYITTLIVSICFFIFETTYGFYSGSSTSSHFLYMFNHANIFHLILNCIGFLFVISIIDKFKFIKFRHKYIYPYLIAVFTSFVFNPYDIPTCGLSSVIYSLLGLFLSVSLFSRKAKIKNKKEFATFWIFITFGMIISAIKESSNSLLHIANFTTYFIITIGFISLEHLLLRRS